MINSQGNFMRVSHELQTRAVIDSANYAEKNMPNALVFFDETKIEMYLYAVNNIKVDGYVAEFGVFQGASLNFIAELLPEKTIYGFDSFYGLPEDWSGWEKPKGSFNLQGELPNVFSNVKLIDGYFKDSLPKWIKSNTEPFALLVIDCDIYSSTNDILNSINLNQLQEGTLILFDEYFGYINWRNHEFKAWQEFVKKYDIDYEYIAINHLQVLIKINKIGSKISLMVQ